MIITVGMVVIVVGILVAIFQISSVRVEMGPIVIRGDFGTIMLEHFILALGWLALLVSYVLWIRIHNVPSYVQDNAEAVLVGLAIGIVWGFVIRAHLWYMDHGHK